MRLPRRMPGLRPAGLCLLWCHGTQATDARRAGAPGPGSICALMQEGGPAWPGTSGIGWPLGWAVAVVVAILALVKVIDVRVAHASLVVRRGHGDSADPRLRDIRCDRAGQVPGGARYREAHLPSGHGAEPRLRRAGGQRPPARWRFRRKKLLVVTTTGSGWVDPALADTFEYISGEDSATVAVQYSTRGRGCPIWSTSPKPATRAVRSSTTATPPPRGPARLPGRTEYGLDTFRDLRQASADLGFPSGSVPFGHGHNSSDYVDGWNGVMRPVGMTSQELTQPEGPGPASGLRCWPGPR